MKLEQLMEGVPFALVQGSLETEVTDIIYDSRKAAEGMASSASWAPSVTATTSRPTAPPKA